MRILVTPLHTATVGGHPLRFFRTPVDDGRPDFPWIAVEDLLRCLGMNRDFRKQFMHKLRANWKEPRTVATTDGLVTIAPHFVAQGTVDALVDEGIAPTSAQIEYERAGVEVMKKFIIPFAFGTDEWFGWMKAAMDRHDDAEQVGR